jgi:hypothetical protein
VTSHVENEWPQCDRDHVDHDHIKRGCDTNTVLTNRASAQSRRRQCMIRSCPRGLLRQKNDSATRQVLASSNLMSDVNSNAASSFAGASGRRWLVLWLLSVSEVSLPSSGYGGTNEKGGETALVAKVDREHALTSGDACLLRCLNRELVACSVILNASTLPPAHMCGTGRQGSTMLTFPLYNIRTFDFILHVSSMRTDGGGSLETASACARRCCSMFVRNSQRSLWSDTVTPVVSTTSPLEWSKMC